MDPETFEDVILDESLIEEAKDFLVETQSSVASMWTTNPSRSIYRIA